MNDTWTHTFTDTQPCPAYGPTHTITVHAGLHHLAGNARPFFSITATINARRAVEAGGTLHAAIVNAWPDLAPVIPLHLSDDTGTPMHALSNGWYWLAGYYGGCGEQYHGGNSQGIHGGEYRAPTREECLTIFAAHVRISVREAQVLAGIIWKTDRFTEADTWTDTRRRFREWVDEQGPRWQREADAACAVLDTLSARSLSA